MQRLLIDLRAKLVAHIFLTRNPINYSDDPERKKNRTIIVIQCYFYQIEQ